MKKQRIELDIPKGYTHEKPIIIHDEKGILTQIIIKLNKVSNN